MTLDEFMDSVTENAPPGGLPETLHALWWAEKGNWEKAHTISQAIETPEGSWIHANLHREEGDLGNARYWYTRAGKAEAHDGVADERRRIIEALL